METESYLGDGVYAEFDGLSVILKTARDDSTHMIYLEPHVIENMLVFCSQFYDINKLKVRQK